MPNLRQDKLNFRQNHAIVIGIDYYPLIQNPLTSAVNDASRIAQLLKNNQGFDNVLVLLEANMPDLMALITWLGSKDKEDPNPLSSGSFSSTEASGEAGFASKSVMGWYEGAQWERESGEALPLVDLTEKDWSIDPDRDAILFYYAGHGIKGDPDNGPAGYVVPADAAGGIGDYRNLIPMDDLYWSLKTLGCLHTLLILDCCFAGKFRFSSSTRFMAGTEVPHLYKERFLQYTRSRAWQVLASSGPDQEANDSFSLLGVRSENSPFAASLIEALQGEADLQQEGVITAVELYLSVRQKVKKLQEQQAEGGKPQHPGLFPMEDHRGGEFIFLNPNFDFDSLKERPFQNPYKGLLPYEPEDREWFFGREKELKEAIRRIENLPLLIISGDSAVGKSSFAKAGLYAYLKRELNFELLYLRPGSKPWRGQSVIAKRKMRDGSEEEVKYFTGLEELLKSVSGEEDLIKGFMEPNTQNRMILIDQYEELFTECKDLTELEAFEDGLQKLMRAAEVKTLDQKDRGTTRIVITIRSDFEWQLDTSAFGQSLLGENRDVHYNLVRLMPLGLDELRDALTGPASKEIFEFEEGLVEQILEDINYAPAALPLLSFTMKKLYEVTMEKGEKDGNGDPKRFFTKHLYADPKEGIEGVIGALRTSANQLYWSLGKKTDGKVDESIETPLQETMKKTILRLIRPGEGQATRRRVYHSAGRVKDFWSELDYPQDEDDQMVEDVLDQLEEAQLIARGKDMGNRQSYIELAHDALVNNWPRSLQWIKDLGQDRLVLLRQLWEAALENKKKSLPADIKQDPYKKEKFVAASNRSAVIQTSILWDNSPKLMEVIHLLWDPDCQISQGENKDILEATANFLENELKEEERSSTKTFLTKWIADHQILIGSSFEKLEALDFKDPAEVLRLVLFEGRHWLNQLEADFVWESWNKRRSRIANLIRERDEARANLYATYAIQEKQKGNFDRGMRLAMKAWKTSPEHPSALIYESFIHSSFSEGASFFIMKSFSGEHKKEITSVEWSPDGKMVLTASSDGTAKLWDTAGELLADMLFDPKPTWHLTERNSAHFSPDCKKIVTASTNGEAKVWDVKGNLLATYQHKEPINDARFCPDSKQIVTASSDATAKVWDLKGNMIANLSPHTYGVSKAAFSLKGDKVLTATHYTPMFTGLGTVTNTAKLWNLKGHQLLDFAELAGGSVEFAQISPREEKVLICPKTYFGLKVQVWDFEGNLILNLSEVAGRTNESDFKAARFSSDGSSIITRSSDDQKEEWDLTGQPLSKSKEDLTEKELKWSTESSVLKFFARHENPVVSFKLEEDNPHISFHYAGFSSDGEKILTLTEEGQAKIWKVNGRLLLDLNQLTEESIGHARFSPDGQFILTSSKGKARIWDLKGALLVDFSKVSSSTTSHDAIEFSPKGGNAIFFYPNYNGEIRDTKGKLKLNLSTLLKRKISQVAFSPDEERAAVLSFHYGGLGASATNFSVTLLDLEGNELFNSGWDEKAASNYTFTRDLQFSADGQKIMYSNFKSGDGLRILNALKIWNQKYNLTWDLKEPPGNINEVLLSPGSENVLIRTGDGIVQMADLYGNTLFQLTGHTEEVNSVQFSPDGQKIVTASKDQTVKIWNLQGEVLLDINQFANPVKSAEFSPDGQLLLCTSGVPDSMFGFNTKSIQIFDLTGHLLANLDNTFHSWKFSPKSDHILAVSKREIRLWPLPLKVHKWVNGFGNIPFTDEEKVRFGMK
jgi:WD40 repeat protein